MGALEPGVAIGAALDWEIDAILGALGRQSIEAHVVDGHRTWEARVGDDTCRWSTAPAVGHQGSTTSSTRELLEWSTRKR